MCAVGEERTVMIREERKKKKEKKKRKTGRNLD